MIYTPVQRKNTRKSTLLDMGVIFIMRNMPFVVVVRVVRRRKKHRKNYCVRNELEEIYLKSGLQNE